MARRELLIGTYLSSQAVGKQLPHRDKLVSTASPVICKMFIINGLDRYRVAGELLLCVWDFGSLWPFTAQSLRYERMPHP